ncbi:hypothetical protein JTE90_029427, partial [Oedothorax gibbosus]
MDGTCTECECGNTTVVEDQGCEFKGDETFCMCRKGYSQKDESCE